MIIQLLEHLQETMSLLLLNSQGVPVNCSIIHFVSNGSFVWQKLIGTSPLHVWVARFHAIPGPAKRDLLRGLGGSRRFVNLWIFGDYMIL